MIFGSNKTDRLTLCICTTRSANAVNVILRMGREIEVDHMCNPFDIDSTGRNICGYKHTGFTILKVLQGTSALVLRTVGMDRSSRDFGLTQLLGHPVGTMLGPGKNEHGIEVVILPRPVANYLPVNLVRSFSLNLWIYCLTSGRLSNSTI